ncbi:MAG: hypothetical protein ACR2ID_05455 [Chthoniobacterales bacterium]
MKEEIPPLLAGKWRAFRQPPGTAVGPSHPLERAVVANLPPGSYSAIVRGVNNDTGIGLIEVFDLEP